MYLKRQDLKEKFNPPSATVPTGKEYALLIDSILNPHDDNFYGEWKPDMPYYTKAVVYHEKNFYALQGIFTDGYCTAIPPKNDSEKWCKIGGGADDDWVLENEKMYANPKVNAVGIGTPKPTAALDIVKKGRGQFKFEPNAKDPILTIVNLDDGGKKNSLSIKVTTEMAHLQTDSSQGYHITKENADCVAIVALAVNTTPTDEPRVGVGTTTPRAHLEVYKKDKGSVRIDGGEQTYPSVTVQNLDKKCDPNYIKMTLGDTEAAFVTDAKGGFQFKQNTADGQQTLVTIADNGRLGIGTTTPDALLHIASHDPCDGSIKAGFCKTYPVIQLVNFKVVEDAPTNFSLLGTDNDSAVWMTDSPSFAFRKSHKHLSETERLADIKAGTDIVRIFDDGKVVIGDIPFDEVYALDVGGSARACGFYIETDRRNLKDYKPLDKVLDKVCDLNPVRFHWKTTLKCASEGAQYGFIADEVESLFSEVVKMSENTKSVAYQNLVPVLVKALQEQQSHIQKLEKTLEQFEKRLCALEG